MHITIDDLWDALREHNCNLDPWTDAKCIVMLRKGDLKPVLASLRKREAALHEEQMKATEAAGHLWRHPAPHAAAPACPPTGYTIVTNADQTKDSTVMQRHAEILARLSQGETDARKWAELAASSKPESSLDWAVEMFGESQRNPGERAARVLEEAIELAQAEGVSLDVVNKLAAHVYGKPAGEPKAELQGLALTLDCYAECVGDTVAGATARELARVKTRSKEEWKARHDAKIAGGRANLSPPAANVSPSLSNTPALSGDAVDRTVSVPPQRDAGYAIRSSDLSTKSSVDILRAHGIVDRDPPTLTADQVEKFAIRAALALSGGEWAEHYTPEAKQFWRDFVTNMADDLVKNMLASM